ncbi:carboxyltransferase domain-containing protein [Microbacterium sp. A204]|uniref:carboxyltransferase domain-containing protein n=1 Tax=Microbacterium sp. A204 TaxID=3457321 RepID=UPI003FD278FC
MRILTASDRALLVEAADLDEAMRLNLAWRGLPGIIERVPGARTVLVYFDPLRTSAAALAELLSAAEPQDEHMPPAGEVTIPVQYDGDDLAETASLLGVSTDELVSRHLAADWRVAFSGFAPGFGYIVGDDPLFDVPRRSSPRTRVPAGAVALAGAFTGVYPRESPGGWQLIGRTDAVMWDLDREPPAPLVPGVVVRFERSERPVLPVPAAPAAPAVSVRGEKPSPRTSVEVIRTSMQLLVQDAGRPGRASLGVSASGVADRTAMRDANRAVGNDRDAAVLESVGGAALRFHGAGVGVVTGAVGDLTVTNHAGEVRDIVHGSPFATDDGDELELGYPTQGLRCVIGIRGGVRAASVLGSRSSDTLSGLGPPPLAAGDVVGVGAAPRRAVDPTVVTRELPAPGDLVELSITLGPRDEWFTASALHTLTTQEWLVTSRADRVGVRLQGEVPLARAVEGELPSEGAVSGAIQVPGDGQPVLFLPDHPLTGGYPIIGALTDSCLDLAAQLPPGARVRFCVG